MKNIQTYLIIFFAVLSPGCTKNSITETQSINRITTNPPPKPLLTLETCINSYADIISVLGASSVIVKDVVLENGVTVTTGGNINSITYQAKVGIVGNSLFHSGIIVVSTVNGNSVSNVSDVWSLGCVYQQSHQTYTNLSKNYATILVNTLFYWGIAPYQGQRVILVDL